MSAELAERFEALRTKMMIESSSVEQLREILGDASPEKIARSPLATQIQAEIERRLRIEKLQSQPGTVENPEVIFDAEGGQNFEGYFEELVRGWLKIQRERGQLSRHQKIKITAGPYRSCAVSLHSDGISALEIDFYAAIRVGFGSLSQKEIDSIINKWL